MVTGGPRGGKSEILKEARKLFAGKILVVPEMSTMLMKFGYPYPGGEGGVEWSEEWQANFQAAIYEQQLALEALFMKQAQYIGVKLLICDRGLLDGAAYTPGGLPAFCKRFGISLPEATARYEAVIHLESVATGVPRAFYKVSNEYRLEETVEETAAVELATREVWNHHPHYHYISCEGGLFAKRKTTFDLIDHYIHGGK